MNVEHSTLNSQHRTTNKIESEIIRELILPELEKEVNEGKHFAQLRQVYHALILATWFKRNLQKSLLGRTYVGQNRVEGIEIKDKQVRKKIYQQYLEAYKKGVYNYIKEDYDPYRQQMIPRKYFSGGFGLTDMSMFSDGHSVDEVNLRPDKAILAAVNLAVGAQAKAEDNFSDIAMLSERITKKLDGAADISQESWADALAALPANDAPTQGWPRAIWNILRRDRKQNVQLAVEAIYYEEDQNVQTTLRRIAQTDLEDFLKYKEDLIRLDQYVKSTIRDLLSKNPKLDGYDEFPGEDLFYINDRIFRRHEKRWILKALRQHVIPFSSAQKRLRSGTILNMVAVDPPSMDELETLVCERREYGLDLLETEGMRVLIITKGSAGTERVSLSGAYWSEKEFGERRFHFLSSPVTTDAHTHIHDFPPSQPDQEDALEALEIARRENVDVPNTIILHIAHDLSLYNLWHFNPDTRDWDEYEGREAVKAQLQEMHVIRADAAQMGRQANSGDEAMLGRGRQSDKVVPGAVRGSDRAQAEGISLRTVLKRTPSAAGAVAVAAHVSSADPALLEENQIQQSHSPDPAQMGRTDPPNDKAQLSQETIAAVVELSAVLLQPKGDLGDTEIDELNEKNNISDAMQLDSNMGSKDIAMLGISEGGCLRKK